MNIEVRKKGAVGTAALPLRGTDNGDGTASLDTNISAATVAYTTPTHTQPAVTTVSGVALAANTNRQYALFINDSDTVLYLKFGATAVVNQGIRLNAAGGTYEMSAMLGNLYRGVVNAIHAGVGGKALLVTEGV